MWQLNKVVIPQIKDYWEDVAFGLRFGIHEVEGIKTTHKDDAKKCCQRLLINWLSTDSGINPKIWETLLNQVKEVEELTASVEQILQQLKPII